MKERHPIDDLFARALRDAEAEPPAGAWAGIARSRGGGVRMRRWWPVVLLLLLGGSSYVATDGLYRHPAEASAPEAAAMGAPGAPDANGPMAHAEGQAAPEEAAPPGRSQGLRLVQQTGPAGPMPAEHAAAEPEVMPVHKLAAGERVRSSALNGPGNWADARASFPKAATGSKAGKAGIHQPGHAAEPHADVKEAGMAAYPVAAASPHTPDSGERTSVRTEAAGTAMPGFQAGSVLRLAPMMALPANAPQAGSPRHALGTQRPGGRHAWWVALTAGSYREARTWHGEDARLVAALQGTEVPHQRTVAGLLAGVEWRGGWSLASGVEYGTGRYDFRHADHYLNLRDSLVTQVVTFNSTVVGSFTDTVTASTEVRRSVATLNRYASVHIPVEVAWHRAWRRWHFGVRGAVGLDLGIVQSGSTLINATGGTRTVDIGTTETRTTVQLTGGPMLDVGYALGERLGLWLSPAWSTTLLSLSPTNGTPYAARTRTGIRLRLAYTLRP